MRRCRHFFPASGPKSSFWVQLITPFPSLIRSIERLCQKRRLTLSAAIFNHPGSISYYSSTVTKIRCRQPLQTRSPRSKWVFTSPYSRRLWLTSWYDTGIPPSSAMGLRPRRNRTRYRRMGRRHVRGSHRGYRRCIPRPRRTLHWLGSGPDPEHLAACLSVPLLPGRTCPDGECEDSP